MGHLAGIAISPESMRISSAGVVFSPIACIVLGIVCTFQGLGFVLKFHGVIQLFVGRWGRFSYGVFLVWLGAGRGGGG